MHVIHLLTNTLLTAFALVVLIQLALFVGSPEQSLRKAYVSSWRTIGAGLARLSLPVVVWRWVAVATIVFGACWCVMAMPSLALP